MASRFDRATSVSSRAQEIIRVSALIISCHARLNWQEIQSQSKELHNWVSLNQNQSNHSGQFQWTEIIQWTLQISNKDICARKTWKNVCVRVKISFVNFGFTSDRMAKWRDFFKPIAQHGYAKPKQMRMTSETQLKTAPLQFNMLFINEKDVLCGQIF